jgi:hypothetical protein
MSRQRAKEAPALSGAFHLPIRLCELTFWGSTMSKRRNRFESWVVANPITVMVGVILLGMLGAYMLGFFEGLKHAGH